MTTQLKAILDRIHAVNEEIATVTTDNGNLTLNCHRYYPQVRTIGALPAIVPIPFGGQHDTDFGSNELTSVWTVQLLLFVDNFFAGSAPDDAQANSEACIDHIVSEYWKRPRLELETATDTQSAGAFDCILPDARLTQTSSIEVGNENIAIVRFTLEISSTTDFERI